MITKTKNIMTKNLVTIPMGSPLTDAYDVMAKGNFRHLPVVEENGNIIGILSQRDLNYIKNPENIPVEYVMSAPVISVDQNLPLREAISKMLQLKISALLIGDDEDNAVGILTTDDLLSYLASLLEEEHESQPPFFDVARLATVGSVADQLANAGI